MLFHFFSRVGYSPVPTLFIYILYIIHKPMSHPIFLKGHFLRSYDVFNTCLSYYFNNSATRSNAHNHNLSKIHRIK